MGKGIVIRSTGSWYSVEDENGQIFNCRIKGKLRLSGIKATNPVAIGDEVIFEVDEKLNQSVINTIVQRKNYIIRKASKLSKQYQIIASNLDLAVILITIKEPVTYTEFIDRFLVTAEAYNIPVLIVINKIDIYTGDDIKKMEAIRYLYNSVGYETLEISIKQSINIENFREIIQNKKVLLTGNSGSGKSSLINKIIPGKKLKTNQISAYHKKGQHTTTFPEMFKVGDNTYLIDTPGIKSFGIIDIGAEELFHYFPEIFKISHNCRYNNCIHVNEPDCAVRESVAQSIISAERYENYLKILYDNNEKYRTM